jgi:hypothetical protein
MIANFIGILSVINVVSGGAAMFCIDIPNIQSLDLSGDTGT